MGEGFIGHIGSTYYRNKPAEAAEIFHKMEGYLTFLDYRELDAKGVDVVTRLEEKDAELRIMKDEMKRMREDHDSFYRQLFEKGIVIKDE